MTDFHLYHFIALVTAVVASWKLPRKWQIDGVSLLSNLFIAWFSPISAICLLSSSGLVYLICRYRANRSSWILTGILYCAIQFLLIRYIPTSEICDHCQILSVLGIAYFTCRHIHYLIEVYKGKISINLRQFWHYQSFLPLIITGPISRYPDFVREIQRRRWDSLQTSIAIERIIYGYATVVIIGNYLIGQKLSPQITTFQSNVVFHAWLKSANDWAYLYAQFSGWSSIAIGFSLLMGIRIKENFNYPFLATNLIEFWQRWHISLSTWCRDYVFTSIIAVTRKPFVAIVAAMVVLGIWHELSSYYFFWGVYHAIGISICQVYQNYTSSFKFHTDLHSWKLIEKFGYWLLTINYIIFSRPIISIVDKIFHHYI